MATSDVDINPSGIKALLKDPAVAAVVRSQAERIASAAGPGHEVTSGPGSVRYRAQVRTATWEARWREATRRNLSRAVFTGGG